MNVWPWRNLLIFSFSLLSLAKIAFTQHMHVSKVRKGNILKTSKITILDEVRIWILFIRLFHFCQGVTISLSNITTYNSIYDVTHFLRVFTPSSPYHSFYYIGIWNNVTFWQIPVPPLRVTSFIDDPLSLLLSLHYH